MPINTTTLMKSHRIAIFAITAVVIVAGALLYVWDPFNNAEDAARGARPEAGVVDERDARARPQREPVQPAPVTRAQPEAR